MKNVLSFLVAPAMQRALLCCMALVASPLVAGAGELYSDITFVGSVHTGSYQAITGISAVATNGGYYPTNAVATTNYYRLCATNPAGRIPLSTNIVVVWIPGAGTNAVQLSWTRPGGVYRQVVERSLDAGATWTNWLTIVPTASSWLDTGSNTWTASVFTNLYSAIPAGTYPWSSTGDLAAHAAAVGTNVHGLGTAATSNATDFATTSQGVAGTNAQARVAVLETNTVSQAMFANHTNTPAMTAHSGPVNDAFRLLQSNGYAWVSVTGCVVSLTVVTGPSNPPAIGSSSSILISSGAGHPDANGTFYPVYDEINGYWAWNGVNAAYYRPTAGIFSNCWVVDNAQPLYTNGANMNNPTIGAWAKTDYGSNPPPTVIYTTVTNLYYFLLTPTNSWATNSTFLRSDDGQHLYWGGTP